MRMRFFKMTPFVWKVVNCCVLAVFIVQSAINVMFYVSRPLVWRAANGSSLDDDRVLSPKLMSRGVFQVDNGQLRFLLNSERDPRLSGRAKPLCPEMPPGLEGHLNIQISHRSMEQLELLHTELEAGGSWYPVNCSSRHRVAIVVPYRDRVDHLRILLEHLHPFLQKQLLDYKIFVVEQDSSAPFNRGMLMNIGFKEANSVDHPYDCFIFHDVDLLPEDDRNIYDCAEKPRHMSAAVDTLGYKLPYANLFGGVSAISRQQFELVNGYSNKFFGWGGEDDDIFNRLKYNDLKISRRPMNIARYKMLQHRKNPPARNRMKYLNGGISRYDRDGVNSLIYKLTALDRRKLFTLVSVVIDESTVIKSFRTASLVNRTSPYLASRAKALMLKQNTTVPTIAPTTVPTLSPGIIKRNGIIKQLGRRSHNHRAPKVKKS